MERLKELKKIFENGDYSSLGGYTGIKGLIKEVMELLPEPPKKIKNKTLTSTDRIVYFYPVSVDRGIQSSWKGSREISVGRVFSDEDRVIISPATDDEDKDIEVASQEFAKFYDGNRARVRFLNSELKHNYETKTTDNPEWEVWSNKVDEIVPMWVWDAISE